MRIGIVSDSHNSSKNVAKAVNIFNEEKVEYVLHAGDFGSASVAGEFAGLQTAKFIAVYGNCDSDKASLQRAIADFGGEIHESHYADQIGDRKVYMTHRPDTIDDIIATSDYDLVIFGHTHDPVIRKQLNTLVVNPGTSMHKVLSKSYVIIMELDNMTCKLVPLP